MTSNRLVPLPLAAKVPVSLIKCGVDKGLDGGDLEQFPVLTDGAGRACEPVVAYLLERQLRQNCSKGTIAGEAYVLKAWWTFLENAGLDWRAATDDDVQAWARRQEGRLSTRRNQDRLDVLARFYQYARTTMRLYAVGLSLDPARRGVDTLVEPEELVSVTARGRAFRRFKTRFRYSTIPGRVRGSRPTPSTEQVSKVLDALADSDCPYMAARDYLMGRWMADAGLRRQGVAGLTLDSLEGALASEGQRLAGKLASLRNDARERSALLKFLHGLEQSGRANVLVSVHEKGKNRFSPVPIPLFLATLEYVWDQRASMVAVLRKRGKRSSDGLWLSKASGRALSFGAVSDYVKGGFRRAGVSGSGHRLRARFAQDRVKRQYLLTRARLGTVWQPEEVLLPVADELGHADLSSLRHYLNGVFREVGTSGGEPVLVHGKKNAELVKELVYRLEKGDPTVAALLTDLLTR